MSVSRITAFACLALLVSACSGIFSAPAPRVPRATSIELCMGPSNCDQGRFRVVDKGAVEKVLHAYRQLDSGWVTAENLAWTMGMFTTPTLRNRAVLLDDTGHALQVLFFDVDMVCSRPLTSDGTEAPDVYHKAAELLVEALQASPRVPMRSERQAVM